MKKMLLSVIAATSLMLASDIPDQYQKCIGCHGVSGEKQAFGKSLRLSEMTSVDISHALLGYQDGSYGGPMKGLMKAQIAGLDDLDIVIIADYLGKDVAQ